MVFNRKEVAHSLTLPSFYMPQSLDSTGSHFEDWAMAMTRPLPRAEDHAESD